MNRLTKTLLVTLAVALGIFAAPGFTLGVAIVGAICVGALYVVASHPRSLRRSGLTGAINTLPAHIGTSVNSRRYLATAAIAAKHLLVMIGADAQHCAALTAVTDRPIGVCTDEAEAAEDPVNVELLGISNRTLPLTAKAAIAIDVDVFSTADSKVSVIPVAAGTYFKVGRSLTAATAEDDPIEVAHCAPVAVVVSG